MDPNPTTLSDEELEKILAEGGVATPGVETPEPPEPKEEEEPEEPDTSTEIAEDADAPEETEEEPAEEEEQPDEKQPAEKKPKQDDKPEGQPSRREQLRIQDLLRKYPPQQPIQQPEAQPTPKTPDALDIEKDLEADEELKTRLMADRKAAADAAYEQGKSEGSRTIAQERATILFDTRLEIDAPRVEGKYPVLDKYSDKFNAKIADDINLGFLNAVGYKRQADDTYTVDNPNIRYNDYVEAHFALAKEIAETMTEEVVKKAEETKKQVVKQAAQTGLRPDGNAPKKLDLNKLPHQMTDEELDAIIAQAVPSK